MSSACTVRVRQYNHHRADRLSARVAAAEAAAHHYGYRGHQQAAAAARSSRVSVSFGLGMCSCVARAAAAVLCSSHGLAHQHDLPQLLGVHQLSACVSPARGVVRAL